jgi:hypothetical protein
MSEMANLVEAIQERCNFIRENVIPKYDRIGPAGHIGKMLLKQEVAAAEGVIAMGDVVEMVKTLQSLRETCERAL